MKNLNFLLAESRVFVGVKLWHCGLLGAGLGLGLLLLLCILVRVRIPRTKAEIEANHKGRSKFHALH